MNPLHIEDATNRFRSCGVVAIIRGKFSCKQVLSIAEGLLAGGLTAMEVTLNSDAATDHIAMLRRHFGDRMLIGAGTVRTPQHVDISLAAGAQFLISPGFDPASVARSREAGALHLPGVFTATEAQAAANAGCHLLKLFPCDAVGPGYLKALRAPFDDVDFCPTGGITADNMATWRNAGAVAVAAGSSLVSGPNQSTAEVTTRATAMRRAWEAASHD